MPARSISWATSGRCSSSVISPPARAGSSSCSAYCPGISTEQLRSRLNRMVADGLLTRQRYREVPPRVDYELTERSRELIPVLGALARWGYDWTWSAPRPGEDVNVGAIFRLAPGMLDAAGGPGRHRRADRGGRGRQRPSASTWSRSGAVARRSPRSAERSRRRPCAARSRRGCARSGRRARPSRCRSPAATGSPARCSTASRTQGRVQLRPRPSPRADPAALLARSALRDALDAHDLVARCLTADHADARRRHTSPLAPRTRTARRSPCRRPAGR